MTVPILLDRSRPETLTDQLVAEFRNAIRKGAIRPGARLASSRKLSEQLGVSRNTVVRAFDLLLLENYAEARPASGIFARLPATPQLDGAADAPGRSDRRPAPPAAPLHAPNRAAEHSQRLTFDFFPERPDPALFPVRAWRRHHASALANGLREIAQYGDPAGCFELRAAICDHLGSTRGIVAGPNQVIIVNGAQEGLSLCARLLLSPGCIALTETPTSQGAFCALESAGAQVAGIGVDANGLCVDNLPDHAVSLIHVTPSHHLPLGYDLAMPRRRQLIEWASHTGCYIIENDGTGDLRYDGAWSPAIASMAPDITIHVGSFSRTLGAGLRLGYMVVPQHLVESARAAKGILNNGTGWLEQAALAGLMASGAYAAHLARLRAAYRGSRDALLTALSRHFGDAEIGGSSGGLHLLWRLPPGVPHVQTLEALARRARVGVYGFASAGIWEAVPSPLSRRGVVFGFGALSARQIEDGIARLSDLIDDRLDLHPEFLGELIAREPEMPGSWTAQDLAPPVLRLRRELVLHGTRARKPLSRVRRNGSGARMHVSGIYRYPVKGLSPQAMRGIDIEAGQPFPFDRVFALARPNSPFDVEHPRWAKKALFLMLMLEGDLAKARTEVDADTLRMTIVLEGRTIETAPLDTPEGRQQVEQLLGELARPGDALPKLVRSQQGAHFMDKPENVLSLINLATLRDLESRWDTTLDPLRFRANFYVDGLAPWEEFDWVGQEIRLGDATFLVDRRNGRCGATNVDPKTGARDRDIPRALRTTFGHKDLGIYLITKTGGRVVVGDEVHAPDRGSEANLTPVAASPVAHAARYICRGCYYIYDEAAGAVQSGAAPGTPFTALPENWRCPDCGTDKSKYRPYSGL